MHLTDFSDYGLRVLIYLCVHEGPASLTQLADAYGISRNHLVKVVSRLAKGGFVATRRGPGGGIELGAPPDRINIGEVVKYTEPHFNLVECFDASQSACKLTPACALRSVLAEAHANFITTLSRYSLADIAKKRRSLAKVFR